jgi:hypothetical protein
MAKMAKTLKSPQQRNAKKERHALQRSLDARAFFTQPIILMPLLIIMWGCLYGILGEIIDINYGFGWDGLIYGTLVQKWKYYVEQHSIDAYRVLRIFPSVMLNFVCEPFAKDALGIIPALTIIKIYRIYTIFVLASAAVAWSLIGKRLHLGIQAQWIGFTALFINFAVMKFGFYYLTLTDITAFTLVLWGLYFFFTEHPIGVLVIGSIGFFTFPTIFLQSALLYCFNYSQPTTSSEYTAKSELNFNVPHNIENTNAYGNSNVFVYSVTAVFVVLGSAGCAYGIFITPLPFAGTQPIMTTLLWPSIVLLLSYCGIICYSIAQWFPVAFIVHVVKKSVFWLRVAVVVALAIALWFGIARQLYNPTLPVPMNFARFFGGTIIQSVSKPLLAPVALIIYFGPSIVLLALLFYRWKYLIPELGSGFMIVFATAALMSGFMTESRQLITLFPFAALLLAYTANTMQWRRQQVWIFAVLGLVSSKIWFRINFDGMNTSAYVDRLQNYDTFPMQNYFMNQGPWMSGESYVYQSIVIALGIGILWWAVIHPDRYNNTAHKTGTA